MRLTKNIKIFFNYFLGPLLFVWLAFSIFNQIRGQARLEESWIRIRSSFGSYQIFYLLAAIFLIPINWGLEALKWKYAIQKLYPINLFQSFKAILAGVSFSVTMPNRIGEYFGRMMYMPEGNRLKTISVTVVGSLAQLLITLIAGCIGWIVLKDKLLDAFPKARIWYQFLLYGLVMVTMVLLFFYFQVKRVAGIMSTWQRARKYLYLVEGLSKLEPKLLSGILLLSAARYSVFLLQYVCVYFFFQVNVPVATILAVMNVVFLAIAVIPSIALLEVGLRGEISLRLMGLFSANLLGISFASVTVWCMNLILPAIVGSLLILNLRIFKKRNEVRQTTDTGRVVSLTDRAAKRES